MHRLLVVIIAVAAAALPGCALLSPPPAAPAHSAPAGRDSQGAHANTLAGAAAAPVLPGPQPASAPVEPPSVRAPAGAPPRPAGLRFRLAGGAAVYVPPDYGGPAPNLVVHFHGDEATVEREFAAAQTPAVLVVVNFKGLSARYEQPFSEPDRFEALLDETLLELKTRGAAPLSARWRTICVSSFSAGFGAVRAILKQPQNYRRIEALYLADTLYAGYADAAAGKPQAAHLRDFRRFAREAARGAKWMFITHSYLQPPDYAGTHETAADLLAHVDLAPLASSQELGGDDEGGLAPLLVVARAERGRFTVLGCGGADGAAHMAHLRNLRVGFSRLPLEK